MSETHWKKNFDYKYTGAYEMLPGETKTIKLTRLCKEEVMSSNGKKQLCLVGYFEGQKKPMVINKTNCKIISKMYGPFIENWIGKSIIIYTEEGQAFGEITALLKVKHSIPKNNTQSFDKYFDQIAKCTTLDQLKNIYLSFSPEIKAVTLAEKDKKKLKLSGDQK